MLARLLKMACEAFVFLGVLRKYTITVEKYPCGASSIRSFSLYRTLYWPPTEADFRSLERELDALIGEHFMDPRWLSTHIRRRVTEGGKP